MLHRVTEQLCLYLDGEGYHRIALDQTMVWSRIGGLFVVSEDGDGRADAALQVKLVDVCMRIESEMGLYETRNGKCLTIWLDING